MIGDIHFPIDTMCKSREQLVAFETSMGQFKAHIKGLNILVKG